MNSGTLGSFDNIVGPQTHSVKFTAAGNFKLVCVVHFDMTGAIHILNPSETLPYDQDFYNHEAQTVLGQKATTENDRGGAWLRRLCRNRDSLWPISPAGHLISPSKTKGYVTLLFFGYAFCPDQCPMYMANIGAALKKLPAGIADEVKLVFLTTDPARDTPHVLHRWLDLLDRRFIGPTGTERAIEAVLPAARFLRPQERDRSTATTEWRTPILFLLIAKIAKITSRMSSVLASGVLKDDWLHDLAFLIKETWTRRARKSPSAPLCGCGTVTDTSRLTLSCLARPLLQCATCSLFFCSRQQYPPKPPPSSPLMMRSAFASFSAWPLRSRITFGPPGAKHRRPCSWSPRRLNSWRAFP